MKLSRTQWISILAFAALFLILYFGFNTTSSEQEALVKSRTQNLEIINMDRLIAESKNGLPGDARLLVQSLEDSVRLGSEKDTRVGYLKKLASLWYSQKNPLISGYYARKIAEEEQDNAEAWAISGTTFAIAAKNAAEDEKRLYALQQSRASFESALSIDSEDINSRINLALSYVDFPDEENPMKGILMLIELNKQYPDNVGVLLQLGRLALGTNQLEKAVERLTRLLEIEPDNKQAHCLLAETYSKMGQSEKAETEFEICNS